MYKDIIIFIIFLSLFSCRTQSKIHSSLYGINLLLADSTVAANYALKDMRKGNFIYLTGTKKWEYLSGHQRNKIKRRYNIYIDNINDSSTYSFKILNEYNNMFSDSINRGMGAEWLKKFYDDLYVIRVKSALTYEGKYQYYIISPFRFPPKPSKSKS